MLEYIIDNQDELTKSEFLEKAEVNNLQTYPESAVKQYALAYKELMSKAELQELSQEESIQMKIYKAELESLKKTTVTNDKLEKETVYYRAKEDVIKSEAIESEFKTLKEQERYQTIIKGFEAGIIDEDTLEKATGHKYFKKEPKPGGGFKYYYTEAQYKKEKGGGIEALPNKDKDLVKQAIRNIEKVKGKSYSPTSNDIQEELNKINQVSSNNKSTSKDSEKKKEKASEGGKSKEVSMVLKEMDNQEEPNYTAALNKVLKQTGANKAKLEKELEKYI